MSVESNLRELYGVDQKSEPFDQVSITVANPETIRGWSQGEVLNPETINYRTFKPEKGGLFCERIFGPTRDWECACGKYKRIKHQGTTCDRCGVEVTLASVRRERMGHIELAVPLSHIWFYKCMPSRIGLLLDMTNRELERVIYYEEHLVTEPGKTHLEAGQLLSENELRDAEEDYGDEAFRAGMGAEAIRDLLARTDLEMLILELEEAIRTPLSNQNRKKLAKRLKLARGFLHSNTRPEWMIMTVLPVIPPDLRPLIPLEGGRFATSDLNDLYRRVINRNNHLRNLMQLKTPEVFIRNEKRKLQEAVDALFDNGRHGRAVTGAGNRALKSLSDMLKGKDGRFRQSLLGKRVDFSGRSVIIPGPDLKLHQCGLPKKMALPLFEPFIIRRLKELGYCHTVRSAKKMIDRRTTEIWDILAEVTKSHPVMLNRAPTLHRLSIQAFEPILIDGSAIQLSPLVCSSFNADFDGDEMSIHIPLSVEAQLEARQILLASKNLFSPSNGQPTTVPTQDIVLGSYYITLAKTTPENKTHLPLLDNISEVEFAVASGKIHIHDWIRLRNPDQGSDTVYGSKEARILVTTAGRVRFNELLPLGIGFCNFTIRKIEICELIQRCFQTAGSKSTIRALNSLTKLAFREATRSGCSIGIVDMVIPEEKPAELEKAYAEIETVSKNYRNGVIADGERYQKVVDVWTRASDNIANALYRKLEYNEGSEKANPLFMMVDSGARGNKNQIKQLSGMRGLMAKPSGEIIERPITSNFREGLSVLEYFISTHGARKGLADTALKTADSGYMTRKLVDVSQDVIITEPDCGTVKGITVQTIYSGDEEAASLQSRIFGRSSCEKIVDPVTGKTIVKVGQLMDEDISIAVENVGHERLEIRSPLTCESERGCCQTCYGLNLATGNLGKIGEAVGIIAAQSIGEPGTQLTMRTFHSGGVAIGASKQPEIKVKSKGVMYFKDLRTVEDVDGNHVVLNKGGSISVRDADGLELESYNVVIGSFITVGDGENVKKNQKILTWDPHSVPIIAESGGKVEFRDMLSGITVQPETDKQTGKKGMTVTKHKDYLHPQVVIVDANSGDVLHSYSIPVGAHLAVKDKQKIASGTPLARTPRRVARTGDITGALPRVAELFEARRPKDACVIAKLDGEISFGGTVRGKRKVIVTHLGSGQTADHFVPMGKHMIVGEGDTVLRGDQITEGPVAPEDLLEARGPQALQEHLNNEVQTIYRSQGVEINDKHIEIIIRQMLRKVKITEPGDTEFLWRDQVEKTTFNAENKRVTEEGGKPAEAEPVLLGITKASIETESFISAASFQDTSRVLTDAATLGKIDSLRGLKENVILGRIIPAGTGFPAHKNLNFELTPEEPLPLVDETTETTLPFDDTALKTDICATTILEAYPKPKIEKTNTQDTSPSNILEDKSHATPSPRENNLFSSKETETRKQAGLLEEISEIIHDYRIGEIPPRSPAVVERWISQFPQNVQIPMLTEMKYLLSRTYITRKIIRRNLTWMPLVATSHAQTHGTVGERLLSFWGNKQLLNIQRAGGSQRVMNAMLEEILREQFDIEVRNCGSHDGPFVYIDDCIFTGGRIFKDLAYWLNERDDSPIHIIIFVTTSFTGGEFFLKKRLDDLQKNNVRKVTLEVIAPNIRSNSNRHPDRSEVFWPCRIPIDSALQEYMTALESNKDRPPPTLRPDQNLNPGHFSSNEGRRLLEDQFLIKGARIKLSCPTLPSHFGPLGAASPNTRTEKFGFGATTVTYRNCPNTCPLTWWVDGGDHWFPLFPRVNN